MNEAFSVVGDEKQLPNQVPIRPWITITIRSHDLTIARVTIVPDSETTKDFFFDENSSKLGIFDDY